MLKKLLCVFFGCKSEMSYIFIKLCKDTNAKGGGGGILLGIHLKHLNHKMLHSLVLHSEIEKVDLV